MTTTATFKRKIIEVALPLDAINSAASREKNIHTGLPANLHTWWARKPLGVARSTLFASLVDDPSEYSSTKEEEERHRARLFKLIEKLADLNEGKDPCVLQDAREEILKSNGGQMPAFWDPFCGGGSIPLEALRLGLTSYATDLNPVAVFITRVLVELAPRHAHRKPINPPDKETGLVSGEVAFEGIRRDVLYYGQQVEDRLHDLLKDVYPAATLPQQYGAGQAKPVAWIWARSVQCPNPSCRAHAPLVNKFWLSTHKGNEAFVHPTYRSDVRKFAFEIKTHGAPCPGTVNRSGATCLACHNPIPFNHIRAEGISGRLS